MINHCDRRITHLSDTDISFVLFNISSKFPLYLECYLLSPKMHKKVNRLNRPKDIQVSLRRVIRLSQWFITLCLWLYCKRKVLFCTLWLLVWNRRVTISQINTKLYLVLRIIVCKTQKDRSCRTYHKETILSKDAHWLRHNIIQLHIFCGPLKWKSCNV